MYEMTPSSAINIFIIQFCFFILESVFSQCDFHPNNFFNITLHTKNRRNINVKLASARTAMTSSKKYWYQVRSSAAERK
jgi:hypothetical protein